MLHAKDDRTVPYVLGQKVAIVQSPAQFFLYVCVLYLQIYKSTVSVLIESLPY